MWYSDRSPSCHSRSSHDVVPRGVCRAEQSGAVHALKLYPAGATTNSDAGVTNLLGKCLPALKAMVEQGLPLLVGGWGGGGGGGGFMDCYRYEVLYRGLKVGVDVGYDVGFDVGVQKGSSRGLI